jgi:hypothetical protein
MMEPAPPQTLAVVSRALPRGGFPPLARYGCRRTGWRRGGAPLAPRRGGGRRKDPVLLQDLEGPHSHTLGHPASGDGRGFDGLE